MCLFTAKRKIVFRLLCDNVAEAMKAATLMSISENFFKGATLMSMSEYFFVVTNVTNVKLEYLSTACIYASLISVI